MIGGRGDLPRGAAASPTELVLTEVDAEVDGDTRFPDWDRGAFDEIAREAHVSESGTPFAFVTYERRDRRSDPV